MRLHEILDYAVKANKVEMVIPSPRPCGLSKLRDKVTEYFTDPQALVDFSSARPGREYDGLIGEYVSTVTYRCVSFEQHTGLTKLGSGAYSVVYAIDDKRVLKIVGPSGDKGYRLYIEAIRNLAGNPYVPRVYYSGTWGGRQVYILERLQSRNNVDDDGAHDDFCNIFTYEGRNRFMSIACPHIAALRNICEENGWGDIGGDNVMLRGDVPVLTDPAAQGGE